MMNKLKQLIKKHKILTLVISIALFYWLFVYNDILWELEYYINNIPEINVSYSTDIKGRCDNGRKFNADYMWIEDYYSHYLDNRNVSDWSALKFYEKTGLQMYMVSITIPDDITDNNAVYNYARDYCLNTIGDECGVYIVYSDIKEVIDNNLYIDYLYLDETVILGDKARDWFTESTYKVFLDALNYSKYFYDEDSSMLSTLCETFIKHTYEANKTKSMFLLKISVIIAIVVSILIALIVIVKEKINREYTLKILNTSLQELAKDDELVSKYEENK